MRRGIHRELHTPSCEQSQLDMPGVGEWCRDKCIPSHKEIEGSWAEGTLYAAFVYLRKNNENRIHNCRGFGCLVSVADVCRRSCCVSCRSGRMAFGGIYICSYIQSQGCDSSDKPDDTRNQRMPGCDVVVCRDEWASYVLERRSLVKRSVSEQACSQSISPVHGDARDGPYSWI